MHIFSTYWESRLTALSESKSCGGQWSPWTAFDHGIAHLLGLLEALGLPPRVRRNELNTENYYALGLVGMNEC